MGGGASTGGGSGGGLALPPKGTRILKSVKVFDLTDDDLLKLWQIFCVLDREHKGTVSRVEIFDKLIMEERNCFGDAIFDLIDPEESDDVEFGEFVQACCTFCCLSTPDMLRFAFSVHDKDRSGMMEMEELHAFIKVLHTTKKGNVSEALGKLPLDQFGRLHFDGFVMLHKQYPAILYPIFRLQQSVMKCTFGVRWWNNKVAKLEYWKKNKEDAKRKEQERIAAMHEKQLARQVLRAMGPWDYYMNAKKRQMFIDSMAQLEDKEGNNGDPHNSAAKTPPGEAVSAGG